MYVCYVDMQSTARRYSWEGWRASWTSYNRNQWHQCGGGHSRTHCQLANDICRPGLSVCSL